MFLKVYADDKLIKTESQKPAADKSYAFTVKLKPGLIKYKVEFGTKTGGAETVLHTATNLVCGDAYLIDGQSNALATDTGEESPPDTSEWIRSYGSPDGDGSRGAPARTCGATRSGRPDEGEKAELGYWGMELAKRLVESQKMPICIINGAVGGTRIDQHQRNAADPDRPDHDLRRTAVARAAGQADARHPRRPLAPGRERPGRGRPDRRLRLGDLPAVLHRHVGGLETGLSQHPALLRLPDLAQRLQHGRATASGDMLREVQRTLPRLYSNMNIMSTLGIKPPGGCHYPLAGWAEFARLIQPLIERDIYGKVPRRTDHAAQSPAGPTITSDAKDAIALEFDQPVVWTRCAGRPVLSGRRRRQGRLGRACPATCSRSS